MMRHICTTILALLVSINLYAVSAYPGLMEIKQPDGYLLKVRMIGDEFDHRIESEDGYTLLYDKEGYLTLAIRDSKGELMPSYIRLRNVKDRLLESEKHFRAIGKHATFSETQLKDANSRRAMANNVRRIIKPKKPVVGVRRFLVVLMEFTDIKFKHTQADFYAIMNEEGYTKDGNQGSVRDYYRENSFGQLDLQSDVAGVYQAKHEMAYYGNNSTGRPEELAIEAMQAAATDYDLKQYDSDGDGYIDGLHIIFAGYGEEAGGGNDCIWSHEANRNGSFCTVDGVKMSTYSCTPELRGAFGTGMSYIGVICHEIGHALGTPDFYDVDYAASGGGYNGSGQWDVMGSGSWNGDGACPAHFNPYSKIYDFRWSGVNDGNKAVSIKLEAKKKDQYLRIDTKTEGEYFLLEYRSQTGFDSQIPGHGLMVWRASENLSKWYSNKLNTGHRQQFYPLTANSTIAIPNNSPSSYGNTNSSSAPFPGSNCVTKLTDETTPSMKSWEGVNTDYPITNINEYESNGFVEFDINGGDHGVAYALEVKKATTNTINVVWGMPLKAPKVMLLWNTEDRFGVPNQETYAIGDSIQGGGRVLCIGSESEYFHQDLHPHTFYYYRICTWRQEENEWYVSGTRIGKTKTDAIAEFPFVEDFESKKIDESWEEELIFGSEKRWDINSERIAKEGRSNFMLHFSPSEFEHQSSRIILPTFNFGGKDNAILSFDYRNWIKSFQVMYRVSSESEWVLLKSYGSDYRAMQFNENSDKIYSDSKKHEDIVLPHITSDYQLSFVADFNPRGDVVDGHESLIIDNIQIHADIPTFVSTIEASDINMTSAKIHFNMVCQEDAPVEIGIEYSVDQKSWDKIISTSSPCLLYQLNANTKYYYRVYSKTDNVVQYGSTKSFRTLPSFTLGNGSQEEPFQITSMEDWRKMRKATIDGCDFKDMFLVLKTSLTLSEDDFVDNIFNGNMDGDGNTLNFAEDTIPHYGHFFINTIGEKGTIQHFKLTNGRFVSENYGVIHDCDVDFNQELINAQNSILDQNLRMGFICEFNCGIIYYCHVKVDSVYSKQGGIGGICHFNHGLISRCSFEGKMAVNNNANLGGIAAYNDGIITQCVNKGSLHVVPNKWNRAYFASVGGIAGSSVGLIDQCVNDGNISAGCSSDEWDTGIYVGGIVGSNDHAIGVIQNCYNMATINTHFPHNSHDYAGGIVGEAYLSNVYNCFSVGNVYADCGLPETRNAVVGHNNMSIIENCYYTNPALYGSWYYKYEDECAKKVDLSDIQSQGFVNQLNTYAQIHVWEKGDDHPVLAMESEDVSILTYAPTNIHTTEATLSGVALGDISFCGLEWKEKNDSIWKYIQLEAGRKNTIIISNLTPATLYEYRIVAETSLHRKYSKTESFTTEFVNSGTLEDPIELWNYDQLVAFRETVHQGNSYGGQVIKLMADIDLQGDKGVLWTPITAKSVGFVGEFNGNGHIIHNMKVVSSAAAAGFFGSTQKCYVHDLTILNGDILHMPSLASSKNIFGGVYLGGVGGIIGDCTSYSQDGRPLVERCSFTGKIEGSSGCMGGIVGSTNENDIVDCYAVATLRYLEEGDVSIGGITGKGYVSDCYFAGNITAPSANRKKIGRLIGDENYLANNSFYQQSDEYINVMAGTPLTDLEMKNGTLLGKLSSEVWCSDNSAMPINHGYPVLITQSAPHVMITDFDTTTVDIIHVKAFFYGAGNNFSDRGFEYTKSYHKKSIENIHTQMDEEFSGNIPYKSGEYIAFRAYARENESTIAYSEWIVIDGKGGYVIGDVNMDDIVDLADAVSMVSHIHGKTVEPFFEKAADLNNDGEIDVFDVTMTINVILNSNNTNHSGAINHSSANENINLSFIPHGLLFGINNPERFTALQFDIMMPQDMLLTNVDWEGGIDGRSIKFVQTGPGQYTVIVFSTNNSPLISANGNLLRLTLLGSGEVYINNVLFVTAEAQIKHFNDCVIDFTTYVKSPNENKDPQINQIYDLQGHKLTNIPNGSIAKGLYIIDKRKVLIK